MSDDPSFDDLVRRARSGDPGAQDRLLGITRPLVEGLVRAKTRGRPEIDPDDVIQNSLMYILSKLQIYDPAEGTWGAFARGLTRTIIVRGLSDRRDPGTADDVDPDRPDVTRVDALDPRLQDVLGTRRLEHPGLRDPSDHFLPTLELMAHVAPPHKVLATFYGQLLFGRLKAVHPTSVRERSGIWGNSRRVLDEVASLPLDELLRGFEAVVLETVPVDPEPLRVALAPLRDRMDRPVRDVVSPQARPALGELLDRPTGDTCLLDYLTGRDPARTIAQWAVDVFGAVRRALGAEADGGDDPDGELGGESRTSFGPVPPESPGRSTP